MRVSVDSAKCQGHNRCMILAEGTFDTDDGGFEVWWESAGGCGPYSGQLTAMYQGDNEPYATYDVFEPSGSQFVETPVRCEGTFVVRFTLTLVDGLGRQSVAEIEREVLFIC